jgi:hypothetical protein
VLLVQQVPHFVDDFAWDPRECTMLEISRGTCAIGVSRSEMLKAHADWFNVLREAGAQTSTPVLDITDEFCDASVCIGARDGIMMYRDSSHISVAASELLAPAFTNAITQASLN